MSFDLNISCRSRQSVSGNWIWWQRRCSSILPLTKGKTVKEVYKILNRCMAEEKASAFSEEGNAGKQHCPAEGERLAKYIDLDARMASSPNRNLWSAAKGLDEQIAELQTQYESVEQEDERSGALDMNLISQKLDEWRTGIGKRCQPGAYQQLCGTDHADDEWRVSLGAWFPIVRVAGEKYRCIYDGWIYRNGSLFDFVWGSKGIQSIPKSGNP